MDTLTPFQTEQLKNKNDKTATVYLLLANAAAVILVILLFILIKNMV